MEWVPHCFYLIDLEGAFIKEPVWFENEEVESVSLHEGTMIRSAYSKKSQVQAIST